MDIALELDTASLLKLTSFLFWSCLYLLSNVKQPDKSPEYHSRVVTLLHGSVSSIVGLVQCGAGSLSICRLTSPVLPRYYALMVWSWGYFAFDTLWCLVYWDQGPLMLAHHFCTMIAITVYMHRNGTGCSFPCTMAFMEITNPLLQTRWFLKTAGQGGTAIFYLIDIMYLSSFLLLRGVLGPYLLYKIMPVKVFGMDQKMIAISLYIVSIGLMLELVSYIKYRYMPALESTWSQHQIVSSEESSHHHHHVSRKTSTAGHRLPPESATMSCPKVVGARKVAILVGQFQVIMWTRWTKAPNVFQENLPSLVGSRHNSMRNEVTD